MHKVQSGKQKPKGNAQYPFADMKLDDSFFIEDGPKVSSRVRAAACNYGARHGMSFSVLSVKEKGVVGYRVWRVK